MLSITSYSFPCLCSEHRFSLPSAPNICYGEQKKRTSRNGRRHMESLMVLVHSPLEGPFTWSLVAKPLQAAGFYVLGQVVSAIAPTSPAYSLQHARTAKQP